MNKVKTYKTLASLQNKNFGEVYTREYGVLGISELDRYFRQKENDKYQLIYSEENKRPTFQIKMKQLL